ncbi:MAG: type III-B CRISPR-associated protein Cas10/Cmr2 [Clostridiales bacterium]|nr:type III-B CRISPR-associated protein Cas10/Cmr2 [Clostridiales bacterium]
MKYYVGITVGPIFNTILEASTPAALWFSSTLFSDISRRICLETEAISETLYSPAFDARDADKLTGGVGKYHDRIIFLSKDLDKEELEEKLKNIIAKIKKDTIQLFGDMFDKNEYQRFLEEYLQIHYVILQQDGTIKDNIILHISPYLDAVECMQTFPSTNENNPFTGIMARNSEKEGANENIKNSILFKNIGTEANQFTKINFEESKKKISIRSIEDIALGIVGEEKAVVTKKYQNYYAVVSADADGMGNFLSSLDNLDQVTEFSEKCLEYSKLASRKVGDFKGMTIYAGGDDLLFLAPVKYGEKTVFELCKEINDCFAELLRDETSFSEKPLPTISFGVSIQYRKFPLYEALERARTLLSEAKNFDLKKNATAIVLEKHSGQSLSLITGNEAFDTFKSMISIYEKYMGEDKNVSELIKGISSSIEKNYRLISVLDDQVRNGSISKDAASWENLFDNEGQKSSGQYISEINALYYSELVLGNARIKELLTDSSAMTNRDAVVRNGRTNESLNTLTALLRLSKFLTEKPGEGE